MKFFQRTVVALLLAASIFTMAACGKVAPPVTELSYSFEQQVSLVERDGAFSVEGMTLVIQLSDNTNRRITLTNSMVKTWPDMSTIGQKTIVITYLGKDYSFNIQVVQNAQDHYNLALQEFLAKANAGNVTVSDITSTINYNVLLSFLGQSNQASDLATGSISYQQLAQLLESLIVKDANEVFEMFVNAFIVSSLGHGNSINFNSLTTSIALEEMIADMLGNLEFDFASFVRNNVLAEFEPYIEEALYQIALKIPFLTEDIYQDIFQVLIDEIYYPYIEEQQINWSGIKTNITSILQDASVEMPSINLFLAVIETLESGEYNHLYSNLFAISIGNFIYFENVHYASPYNDGFYDFVPVLNETPEQTELREFYFETVLQVIRNIESLPFASDYFLALSDIVSGLADLNDMAEYMKNSWDYYLYDISGQINYQTPYMQMVQVFSILQLVAIGDFEMFYYIISDELSRVLTNALADQSQDLMQVRQDVYNYLFDAFVNFEDTHAFDALAFVNGLQAILQSPMLEAFLNNIDNYGSPMLLSTMLQSYVWFISSYYDDFNSEIQQQLIDDMNAMLPLLQAIDTIIDLQNETLNLNYAKLLQIQNALITVLEYNYDNYAQSPMDSLLYSIMIDLLTENADHIQVVLNYIDDYKTELSGLIAQGILQAFMLDVAAYSDLQTWAYDNLLLLTSNELNYETALEDLFAIFNASAPSEVKASVYSVIALVAFFMEDVDYNALFEGIELPPQIDSIDYNLLVEQLKSAQTYDVLTINDITVQTVVSSEGTIIKEILTLSLSLNFDIMISQIIGELNLVIELNY